MEPTKLTRKQYLAKVNKWLADNPQQWQQIRATQKYPYTYLQSVVSLALGEPVWRDRPGRNSITGTPITPDDPGVGFKLFPVANGKVGAKSDPTRKATRGNSTKGSSGTRQYMERATSPLGTNFHATDRRMGEANSRGFDGGHKTPIGRQLAGQEFKVQSGRGTVQEYQSNFRQADISFGHTVENIEDQTSLDNRKLQLKDYAKLDKALGQMETNPQRLDYLLNKSKEKSKPKPIPKPNGAEAARLSRNLLIGPFSIGAGLIATGQQAQATIANPTAENITNLVFDASNSVTDLAGLFPPAAGLSEAVQRGLSLGQMGYNAQRAINKIPR
jgi:hypothetical protein